MTTPLGNGLCVFKNITGGSLNSQGWPWASNFVTAYTGGEKQFSIKVVKEPLYYTLIGHNKQTSY